MHSPKTDKEASRLAFLIQQTQQRSALPITDFNSFTQALHDDKTIVLTTEFAQIVLIDYDQQRVYGFDPTLEQVSSGQQLPADVWPVRTVEDPPYMSMMLTDLESWFANKKLSALALKSVD